MYERNVLMTGAKSLGAFCEQLVLLRTNFLARILFFLNLLCSPNKAQSFDWFSSLSQCFELVKNLTFHLEMFNRSLSHSFSPFPENCDFFYLSHPTPDLKNKTLNNLVRIQYSWYFWNVGWFFCFVLVFHFWTGKKVIFLWNKLEGEKWQKFGRRSVSFFW